MNFTVILPNQVDAMGIDAATRLFPSAASIEVLFSEPRDVEVRVTYDQPGWIENYELSAKAAKNLINAWPDQVDEIMQQIRPEYGGFWGFNRWGMFVGVEPDGYIHT